METGSAVNVRAFLAVPVARLFLPHLEPFLSTLKQRYPSVRWGIPASVHLTLHFFGTLSTPQIEKINRSVKPPIERTPPFEFFLEGLGAFPNFRNARVFWIGCGGEIENLRKLHLKIEEELQRLGFPREERTFQPHITIGRLKGGIPPAEIEKVHFPRTPPQRIQEIILFSSHLTSEGPEHRPIYRYALEAS